MCARGDPEGEAVGTSNSALEVLDTGGLHAAFPCWRLRPVNGRVARARAQVQRISGFSAGLLPGLSSKLAAVRTKKNGTAFFDAVESPAADEGCDSDLRWALIVIDNSQM